MYRKYISLVIKANNIFIKGEFSSENMTLYNNMITNEIILKNLSKN